MVFRESDVKRSLKYAQLYTAISYRLYRKWNINVKIKTVSIQNKEEGEVNNYRLITSSPLHCKLLPGLITNELCNFL